jgi:hypothetical protein
MRGLIFSSVRIVGDGGSGGARAPCANACWAQRQGATAQTSLTTHTAFMIASWFELLLRFLVREVAD